MKTLKRVIAVDKSNYFNLNTLIESGWQLPVEWELSKLGGDDYLLLVLTKRITEPNE